MICTDGVYGSFPQLEGRHLKPHRKPRNRPLTEARSRENNEIIEFCGDIERRFGTAVSKLEILQSMIRHEHEAHIIEVKIGKYKYYYCV